MEKDTLVTLITTEGEFIGYFQELTEHFYVMKNARSIMIAEDGPQIAPNFSITGIAYPEDVSINRSHVFAMIKSHETMEETFKEHLAEEKIATESD